MSWCDGTWEICPGGLSTPSRSHIQETRDLPLHHVERHHIAAVFAVLPPDVGPRLLDGRHHRVDALHGIGVVTVGRVVRMCGLSALLDHVLAVVHATCEDR